MAKDYGQLLSEFRDRIASATWLRQPTRTVKTWGIYKGYVPSSWPTPNCDDCSKSLVPWIDWHTTGCIGYCKSCHTLKHVWSETEPAPGVHLKTELEVLIGHHVTSLELGALGFDALKQIWHWHESIPLQQKNVIEINELRLAQRGSSESRLVLEHLLWSLIWNAEGHSPELLGHYLDFAYRYPHLFFEFQSRHVWMGHELDLVTALEHRYGDAIVAHVHRIYKTTDLEPYEFGHRLGFYIPRSDMACGKFGPEFLDYARRARTRPAED